MTARLTFVTDPDQVDAIDQWRFDNRPSGRMMTRSEAIRELVNRGLRSEPAVEGDAKDQP